MPKKETTMLCDNCGKQIKTWSGCVLGSFYALSVFVPFAGLITGTHMIKYHRVVHGAIMLFFGMLYVLLPFFLPNEPKPVSPDHEGVSSRLVSESTIPVETPTPTEDEGVSSRSAPKRAFPMVETPTPAPIKTPAILQSTKVLLEIAVWDEMEKSSAHNRMEIWVKGYGSWFPDLKYGGDKHSLGEFTVGGENEFFFYPKGRDGIEIKVPFKMTNEMISGSDQAQTIISVYDNKVEVFGQAIGRSIEYPLN